MPFLHFTVAVEYKGRLTPAQHEKLGEAISESIQRHANVVAVHQGSTVAPKVRTRVIPRDEMPQMREHYGWHQHDNDAACTPCVRLYEYVHQNTL